MYLKVLIITVVLVALAFAGLAISILLKKGGKFPQSSIGKNKEMHKRGITCVKHDEIKCHNQMKNGTGCSCGE
jgi:hypothetical protein